MSKELIYVGAAWCGPCKMLKPIMNQVKEATDVEIHFYDADTDKHIVDHYGITSVPTVIVAENTDDNKQIVLETIIGVNPAQRYIDAVSSRRGVQ